MSVKDIIGKNAFVKRAEFLVTFFERGDDGELQEKAKRIVIDPSDFSITEHQRYRKIVGADGSVTELDKIGSPYAVIVGTLVFEEALEVELDNG